MKTQPTTLKRIIAISSLALLMTASPTWAQSDTSSGSAQQGAQQSSATEVNQPQQGPQLQTDTEAQMSRDQMQRDTARTGAVVDEPAGAANEGTNWSWLGLLGLLGLFGLKRRHEAHDDNYRPVRTA